MTYQYLLKNLNFHLEEYFLWVEIQVIMAFKTRFKYILIILLISPFWISLSAQHSALTSQYMFNGLLINPAYAGAKEISVFTLNYRNQWTGFDGAPKTQSLTYHKSTSNGKIGMGGILSNDEIGVTREMRLLGNFAYRVRQYKGTLSFGLGAGAKLLSSKWTEIETTDPGDEQFSYDTRNALIPEFNAGIYYQNQKMYFGFSIPVLLDYNFEGQDDKPTIHTRPRDFQYVFTGGFAQELSEDIVLKPSILLKAIPSSSIQFDFNTNVIFYNKLWLGASYRTGDAVLGMVEFQAAKQLKFGYAYDLTVSPLSSYTGATHEIMLQYMIGDQRRVVNPRGAPKYF